MKYEEMIKEIYFVAGMLEGLSVYIQRNTSEAAVTMLGDCVDRLEIVGAQLVGKCDVSLEIKGMPSDSEMIAYLSKKQVISDEGRPEEAFGRVYPPPGKRR